MRINKRRKPLLFIVSTALCATILIGGGAYLSRYILTSTATNIPGQTVLKSAKPVLTETYNGLPIRIKIPVINIDAAIEYTGNTSEGNMAAPSGPATVGWYKYGAIPGDKGSAVIAGHQGYANNQAAIFDNLDKLKSGDKIYIETSKGELTFVVQRSHTYSSGANSPEVFNQTGGNHLNLITCEGAWNRTENSYKERLVVFADKLN